MKKTLIAVFLAIVLVSCAPAPAPATATPSPPTSLPTRIVTEAPALPPPTASPTETPTVSPSPTPQSFEQWLSETQQQASANAESQKDTVEALFGVAGELDLTIEQGVDFNGHPIAVVVTVDNRPQTEKDALIDLTGIPLQITIGAEGEWTWVATNLRNVANAGNTNMLAYVDISDATWDGDHIDTKPPYHLQPGNTYAQTEELLIQNFNTIFPGVYAPERLIDYSMRPPGHFSYFAAENGLNNVLMPFFRGDFLHQHQQDAPQSDAEVDAYVVNRIDFVLDQVELQKEQGRGGVVEIVFANEGINDDGTLNDEIFMAKRYNRDGNNWYSEAFVRIVQAASERGLVLGKDYVMVAGEYGLERLVVGKAERKEVSQQKAEAFVQLIQTLKQQAAARLGLSLDEIQIGVWDQFHTYGSLGDQSGMGGYNLATLDDSGVEAMIKRLQWIRDEVGPIQIGELDISGAKDDAERIAVLQKVTRICKEVHCTSIGLYAPFSTEEENIGIFRFNPQDKTMQKTGLYYIYLKFLLSMLDTNRP